MGLEFTGSYPIKFLDSSESDEYLPPKSDPISKTNYPAPTLKSEKISEYPVLHSKYDPNSLGRTDGQELSADPYSLACHLPQYCHS